MREVRGSGEPGLFMLFVGGGVADMARGVGYADDDGEGDVPGDEYPKDGLVTRFWGWCVVDALKIDRDESSSGVAVSTSLSNDDRNEGSPLVSI